MSMTNFTGADMPGSEAWEQAHASGKPAKAENKAPAKKADKKPGVAPSGPPESTNTDTHGVGPSTVEGQEVSDETKEAIAESVGGKSLAAPSEADADEAKKESK